MLLGNAVFLGRVFSRERKKLVESRSSGSSIQSDPAHVEPSNTQQNLNVSRNISAAKLSGDSTSSSLHNSIRFIYELVEDPCATLMQNELLYIKLHMTFVFQLVLLHFPVLILAAAVIVCRAKT